MNHITYNDFLDKIHGCWYGKCLGGAAGAPAEGLKKLVETEDFTEIFNPDLPNDDLDIQLLWLEVLEQKGLSITSEDLADAWLAKCWYPFSEYGYFLKNYERGVKPPYSGIINNSFFKEGMGCAIRSEIWGLISAGNPELAVTYAYNDACLDHADNAIYAEQFLAAAESMAFFETDMCTLLSGALTYIPADCKLAKCFAEVMNCYRAGTDWSLARKKVLDRYSHPDFTNIIQNMGFVLIALLYGEGDMRATINIALKCGYDTDCTCASAAALLGIMTGYKALGDEIGGLIQDYFVCGIDVKRPSDSVYGLALDTAAIALSVENDCISVTDVPEELAWIRRVRPQIVNIYPTQEGYNEALAKLQPVCWQMYGPYFEQMEQPIDPHYPSPHSEGCSLPDVVCMVNNQVFLDKAYIDEGTLAMPEADYMGLARAYEDLIPIEQIAGMEGQMCVYLKTTVVSPKKQKMWMLIGNTDGFKVWVNKKEVLAKDEIRTYTPYNNFCLPEFEAGENEVVIKLLRRTDHVQFALGLRRFFEGVHWHRSKWHTDLEYK